MPYEQTFVGLIAEQMPEKKIANLGVMSYSPTIYYLRLIDFLDKGYTFKELVVYIDISDIQDEANYAIVDGRVVDTIKNIQKQQMFPLLNFGLKGLRDRLRTIFSRIFVLRSKSRFIAGIFDGAHGPLTPAMRGTERSA